MLVRIPDNIENYCAKIAIAKQDLTRTVLHTEVHSIYNAAQLLIYNSPRPHSATSKAYFLCILLCPTS